MLKKLCISGCMLLAVLAGAAGCAAYGTASAGGTSGSSEVLQEDEDLAVYGDEYIVVGFSQVGSESDWRIANSQSFRDTFTEENGYYLIFEDGQQEQENQLKAVREFILQEVDYIVLDPIVETGWDAVLQEAKDAGIPVIITDRGVDVEDDSLYTCWVGSDFAGEGRNAGLWLVDYLEETGRDQEEINIVILRGTEGSTAQIGRTDGFNEILETQENWTVLDEQDGDFTQTKGLAVMEEVLELYEDIDVVICQNDNMTFGAIEAIEAAGRTCGPDGDIILISFDAVRAALEAVMDGKLHAVFECDPLQGPVVDEVIRALENGEEVEKITYMEETYFDYTMDLTELLETRAY